MQPKSFRVLAVSSLIAVLAPPALAADYQIDPSHSFIEFRTQHFGFSWLSGRFNSFEGSMAYDPEGSPEDQSVTITIDAESLDTNHEKRDEHLRSKDFFDVGSYPTITFTSTGFEGDAEGGTLSGELTFLGVTKEIAFDIRRIGEGEDPWGKYRAGFEGQYTLSRSDFGMDFDLGPAAEQVELDLMIEAVRQ
ncbi:MAG: YceI family protein [Alphaproteobacteria bacterium]